MTSAYKAALGDIGAGLTIYEGLKRGGVYGKAAAATGGIKLGANLGLFGENTGLARGIAGGAGNVLGIVGGLEQGGVGGDAAAAINAAELGARTGAFGAASQEVGQIAGEAVIPLSVYQFAKNWRSGATGSDAITGAESGAAIGSALLPGVGSLIGLGLGAAVGAISSIFGPGRKDPETIGWDQYAQAYQQHGAQGVAGASPQENFQMLAGIFDARGSQIPFYQKFGRMGENQFMDAMAQRINQAVASGAILKTDTPAQIYKKVVEPWINSMTPGGWQNTSTIQGAPEKQAIGNLLTNLIGDYTSGQITAGTPVGIKGQAIPNLPSYKGTPTAPNMTGGPGAPVPTQGQVNTAGQSSMLPTLLAAGGAAALPFGHGAPMQRPNYQTNDPTMLNAMGATGPGGYTSAPTGGSAGGAYSGALSPLAMTGIAEGIGLLGAGYAQHQSNQTIAPLSGAAGPYIGAGQTLLNRGMNNQLTPQQSNVVNTSQQQGKVLINAASPVGQIAQGLFQQYQSGNLKPGDQAQLDQQVASAKAQIAQSLGPNVDSTTLQTYYDQIDQQALITKGKMLDQYMATGNAAFDTWSTTTQAGQKAILAGQEFAVTSIDNTFQQAFQSGQIGGTLISDAVHATLSSNQQLAKSFGDMTSNLAKAYALAQYANAASGGGGGGSAVSPTDLNNMNQQVTGAIDTFGPTDSIGTLQFGGPTPLQAPTGTVEVGQPGDYTDVMGSSVDFSGGGDFAGVG